MSNSDTSQFGQVRLGMHEAFHAYDNLPRSIRRVLSECQEDIDPIAVYQDWRRHQQMGSAFIPFFNLSNNESPEQSIINNLKALDFQHRRQYRIEMQSLSIPNIS